MAEMTSEIVDPNRVAALYRRELARFRSARPRSAEMRRRGSRHMPAGVPMAWMAGLYEHPVLYVESGLGAWFTDVDGHRYLDVNLADSSSFCGFAPPAVVEAVSERSTRGSQFLLADEDSLVVAEQLAGRFGLPKWQLTLSSSQANVEAIRLARAVTGREKVLVFDGKYHGMLDETLVVRAGGRTVPEYAGLSDRGARDTVVVAFDDLAAVERVLLERDVACVLTEPALTNRGIVLPVDGFHGTVRALCSDTSTILIIDEAHTLQCGPGGLTRAWGLRPDILTVGKSIGGGVPIGAYGMVAPIADVLEHRGSSAGAWHEPMAEVATGGTLSGSALQVAGCRAALERVLTNEAYTRTSELGERLADGIEERIGRSGVQWSVARLPGKVAYRPRSVVAAQDDWQSPRWLGLSAAMRVWFANRGVWEATRWGGPAVSIATTRGDIDLYLGLFGDLLDELTA